MLDGMETWIPAGMVFQAIASILHKNENDPLSDDYVEICAEAVRVAQADLVRILTIRGYSASQIANWSDRGRYLLDQSIFSSLCRAPAFGSYPDNFVKTFDRRKELMDSPAILIAGEAVVPGPSEIGGIVAGRLKGMRRLGRRFDAITGNWD